jgi:prepilin-type N-terminal cleavage/methylation domain-containing protein/prepilin-type processing-associated H-X9-DG protein
MPLPEYYSGQKESSPHMRLHSLRTGFTLVELLVVIAIIGTLMGLLLPAVQSARESGRRSTCMNSLSQLSKATIAYDGLKGALPGWRNKHPNTVLSGSAAFTPTWAVLILPNIERNDVYKAWENNTPPNTWPNLEIFTCPSSPSSDSGPAIAYAANAGNGATGYTITSTGTNQIRSDGLMVDGFGVAGLYLASRNSLDNVSSADGTSTTLMFAEKNGTNYTQPYWSSYVAGPLGASGFSWNGIPAFGIPGDYPGSGFKPINSLIAGEVGFFGLPSSKHSGGILVGFCDGHARFISDSLPTNVYAQLVTSDSKLGPNASDTYALPNGTNSVRANAWLEYSVTSPRMPPVIISESDF